MIYILHLSDLHFIKNASAYNTEAIILREAAEKVKSVPQGKKMLVVTGDFHNFFDKDYSKAEVFLTQLAYSMDIDLEKDVFVVPGNHDVGNDGALMPLLESSDPNWKKHNKAALLMLKNGDTEYIEDRLMAFRSYSAFVQRLGIYHSTTDADFPAKTHLRNWRGKLNILHLNTALVADGTRKSDQLTDVDTAASSELWDMYFDSHIPSIAIGHNSFYDLKKEQRLDLAAVFALHNVSAYLCGDRHHVERDIEQQMIRVEYGHKMVEEIPNLVAAKGIGDGDDTYSEIGYSWHLWDEKSNCVTVESRKWTRNTLGRTISDGEPCEYLMRIQPPSSSVSAPSGISSSQSVITISKDPFKELRSYLFDVFRARRDAHPSFRLLKVDEIDKRLFPRVSEYREIVLKGRTEGAAADWKMPCDLWEIIRTSWSNNNHQNIVINGAGGIGKTVALFSIVNNYNEFIKIPAVYIPMYELVSADGEILTLTEYIKSKYPHFGSLIESLATRPWKDCPTILFLLDGFDDIPFAQRRTALFEINEWYICHPGAQIIAASRPMSSLDLSVELAGNPISLSLLPLDRRTILDYLHEASQAIPPDNSVVWNYLCFPIFLNLYIKTERIKGVSAAGYPLEIKEAKNSGALIWNYLQRELLRHTGDNAGRAEAWVVRCAMANEYILPFIAYKMVSTHRMDLSYIQVAEYTDEALKAFDINTLPHHLKNIWKRYKRTRGEYLESRFANASSWIDTVLQETGLLVPTTSKKNIIHAYWDTDRYVFVHQYFRDCLAGLHLVNQAEIASNEKIPLIWEKHQSQLALNYAAELITDSTANALWEGNRLTQQYSNAGDKKSITCTYNLLELYKYNSQLYSRLDFSGMDLRGLSLTRYLGLNGLPLPLFRESHLSKNTYFDRMTFLSDGHTGFVNTITVSSEGLVISGSADTTIRVWDPSTGHCLMCFHGHTNSITCVIVLSDGRIVSGSTDMTICIWDLSTGKMVHRLSGHTDSIECIAQLPNGCLVSGASDKTLRIWDLDTGECLHNLIGHSNRVNTLAVLPDGRIVSGSDDNTLRIWDPYTGQMLIVLRGHTDWITCVGVLPDGRVVSGSDDMTIRVWDPSTGCCLNILEGHTSSITGISILPDGRIVSSAGDYLDRENTLRIWDANTGTCLYVLAGHTGEVKCTVTLPDGRIASASSDNTIRIWDSFNGLCLMTIDNPSFDITCIGVLPDGLLVSGSNDTTLCIWDSSTGQCLQKLQGHLMSVKDVLVISKRTVVSRSEDSKLRIWDISKKQCLQLFEGHEGRITCTAIMSDKLMISGSSDGTLRVWDLSSGKCIQALRGHSGPVSCIAISSDGYVVSSSLDKTLKEWDPYTGQCLQTIVAPSPIIQVSPLKDGNIICCDINLFSRVWNLSTGHCLVAKKEQANHMGINTVSYVELPDGHIISSVGSNCLELWNPSTGERIRTFDGHISPVSGIALLHNGRVVSYSGDNELRVWEVSTGECISVLSGHTKTASCIAVLSDHRIISGSEDGTLRVWDTDTGVCLRTLEGHTGVVNCVSVLSTNQVISGSDDGTLRLWNVKTGVCLNVLEATEVDVSKMDFSLANITPDLARLLWMNQATISEADYKNKVRSPHKRSG